MTPQPPPISVIIPVYNTEKYLDDCIASVLRQTFSDFELLLINDGSSDHSAAICDACAKLDPRIHVIHKNNEGVAMTRNLGIQLAKGKYIIFIDSDDTVKANFIEMLFNAIHNYNVEVAIAKFYRFDENCNIQYYTNKTAGVINQQSLHKYALNRIAALNTQLASKDIYYFGFYCCIYSKEKLLRNHITFPPCKIGEDNFFLIEYLLNCKNAYFIDKPLYGYRKNLGSAIHNPNIHLNDIRKRLEKIDSLYSRYNSCFSNTFEYRRKQYILYIIYDACLKLTRYHNFYPTEVAFLHFQNDAADLLCEFSEYLQYFNFTQRNKIRILQLLIKNKTLYHLYCLLVKKAK